MKSAIALLALSAFVVATIEADSGSGHVKWYQSRATAVQADQRNGHQSRGHASHNQRDQVGQHGGATSRSINGPTQLKSLGNAHQAARSKKGHGDPKSKHHVAHHKSIQKIAKHAKSSSRQTSQGHKVRKEGHARVSAASARKSHSRAHATAPVNRKSHARARALSQVNGTAPAAPVAAQATTTPLLSRLVSFVQSLVSKADVKQVKQTAKKATGGQQRSSKVKAQNVKKQSHSRRASPAAHADATASGSRKSRVHARASRQSNGTAPAVPVAHVVGNATTTPLLSRLVSLVKGLVSKGEAKKATGGQGDRYFG